MGGERVVGGGESPSTAAALIVLQSDASFTQESSLVHSNLRQKGPPPSPLSLTTPEPTEYRVPSIETVA